ncbi:MAG: DegT/DnrJ/EryC1/StrS family aminotransferase [Spirochaetia bacterium]|nr:DegT/DnrJ/EryC1/StrS family aminotransferase [Spirochaetia bacterium]
MAQLIQFVKPTLRRKDMQAVLQTMVDERIGPGERKKEFLSLLCTRLDMKGGMALRSYFQALLAALSVCGVHEGSAILTSVLSPAVYGIAARRLGAKLVLCDINRENGCLSTSSALDALSKENDAVLLVDEPYSQIPSEESYHSLGIPVIEDIRESLASSYDGLTAGSIGDIVICAFEEQHILSCGGGAAILYKEESWKKPIHDWFCGTEPWEELPDMNAALGIVQLSTLDAQLERRRELYRLFHDALLKTDHKPFGNGSLDFDTNGWNFPVVLDSKSEDVIKFAEKYHVSCRKMFDKSLGAAVKDKHALFPQAMPALLRAVSFPLYPFLKGSEVDTLIKVISHLP